jgi:hypothetical protein
VKICEKFTPKFGDKDLAVASRQRTVSRFHFHQEIFDQKRYDCGPHPSYFSLFPRLKKKLKGRHFDTIEVIEAESQAMLNTLTEHGFLDAFKYWQKRWKRCTLAERTSSRMMMASRPKVSF